MSESETEPESDLDDVDTQQRESRTATVIDISDDEALASRWLTKLSYRYCMLVLESLPQEPSLPPTVTAKKAAWVVPDQSKIAQYVQ